MTGSENRRLKKEKPVYYMEEIVIFYYDDVLFCTCIRDIEPCLQCVLCGHEEDYDDLTFTHSVLVYENITRHNERKQVCDVAIL